MTSRDLLKDLARNFIIAISIGSLSGVAVSIIDKYIFEKPKHELEFSSQIKELDNVSDNLVALQKFINEQRTILVESEKTIQELKEEENNIRPVIEADRKTIEALFKLQADISARNVWIERGIAFILGVFSSLLATLIIATCKRKSLSTS